MTRPHRDHVYHGPRPAVRRLAGEIATTVEQAKADDPKALHATIADLRKQLDAKGAADPAEVKTLRARIVELEARPPERVEVPMLDGGDLAKATALAETLKRHGQEMLTVGAALTARIDAAIHYRAEAARAPLPARPEPVARRERPEPSKGPPSAPRVAPAASGDLGGGPMKMLAALAGTREGRATRTQLGMLAGFSSGGGTFAKYLSQLRTAGLVEGDGTTLVITADGRERVGPTVRAVTTTDVHGMWRAKLGGGPRKMLDALIATWPHGLTREDLGTETGFEPSGGTFAKYLSTLSGLDIIEKRGGVIVASEALFPTGALQ